MKNSKAEIQELYDKKLLKEKVEKHIIDIERKLKLVKKELKNLEIKLNESERNLEEFEKLSLRNLFLKVLGNKEQQLERERQNYLMNILKFRNCEERIKSKNFEIQVLNEKLLGLNGIEEQLDKLLKRKKSHLKFKNKELAKDIFRLENNIRIHQSKKKEVKEALECGVKVLDELAKLDLALQEIKTWKSKINVVGSSYNEKKNIEKTLRELNVNAVLENFIDELIDVSDNYKLDYKPLTNRLATFLENFYDGLISDWIFHEKIKITLNLVLETIDKVKRIIAMLQNDLEQSTQNEIIVSKMLQKIVLENEVE